jgi:hypothetical protein
MNYGFATMYIGGTLSPALLNLITEGALQDPGSNPCEGWSVEEVDGRPLLVGVHCGGLGGISFESKLEEAGVAFDHYEEADPTLGIEEMMTAFRPGLDPLYCQCDVNGVPVTPARDVRGILDNPDLDSDSKIRELRGLDGVEMERFLEQHPLQSLEIVEDEAPVPVSP